MRDIGTCTPTSGTAPPFFPAPLPDDSLYGLICRYHQISGNAHPSETRKQLVGKHHHWPDHLLTRDLVVRIADVAGITVDYLIDHYTQIPVCEWLDHGFPRDGQDCLDTGDIIFELFPGLVVPKRGGIMPYWRDAPKICMMCYDNDFETVGFPYWHLSHQPQFVTVCAKHRTRLLFGCPQCGNRFPCTAFELPTPECRFCDGLTISAEYVSQFRVSEIEVAMAQVTKHIIDCRRRPRFGWCSAHGNVRLAARLGMGPVDFFDKLGDFNRFAHATKDDLSETKSSWGVWTTGLSIYVPARRFEGFRVFDFFYGETIGDMLLEEKHSRRVFAMDTLWLFAYAITRGVDMREAVSIYMGDDFLQ